MTYMKLLTPLFFHHFLLFLLGLAQNWFKYHFVPNSSLFLSAVPLTIKIFVGPNVMHHVIPYQVYVYTTPFSYIYTFCFPLVYYSLHRQTYCTYDNGLTQHHQGQGWGHFQSAALTYQG